MDVKTEGTSWCNSKKDDPKREYGVRSSALRKVFLEQEVQPKDVRCIVMDASGEEAVSEVFEVQLTNCYWNKCPELRSGRFRGIFERLGCDNWPSRKTHIFELVYVVAEHLVRIRLVKLQSLV